MALGTGDVLLFRDSPCEHRVTGSGPLAEIQSAAAGGAAARVEATAADAASIAVREVCLIRISKILPSVDTITADYRCFARKVAGHLLSLFSLPTVPGYGHLITR